MTLSFEKRREKSTGAQQISFAEYVLVCPDGTGGKIFLRVLLHLVMHDYPPLVSGALK